MAFRLPEWKRAHYSGLCQAWDFRLPFAGKTRRLNKRIGAVWAAKRAEKLKALARCGRSQALKQACLLRWGFKWVFRLPQAQIYSVLILLRLMPVNPAVSEVIKSKANSRGLWRNCGSEILLNF